MLSGFSIAAIVAVPAILAFFWWRKASIVQGIALANLAVYTITVIAGEVSGSGFGSIVGTPLLTELAFRPSDLAEGRWTSLWKILASTFLHANFPHVFGNLVILLLAGMPFEERVGRGRFLGIYVFTAVAAVLMHTVYDGLVVGPASLRVPVIGASGAVFGMLGAFATMYPRDRIPMWLIFIILPRVQVIVAALVLMAFEGFMLLALPPDSVARAAHLGGAVGGALVAPLMRRQIVAEAQRRHASSLDLDALGRQATNPTQQRYLERLRQNLDEPEARHAWFERLVATFACPECGQPYATVRGATIRCAQGHEVRYDTR